ncbi:hypothetical protein NAEGRDRAFT_77820 [Naegleria gruberi]|uniref:Uncharacterized protein n=1 Tax=Naegleria gruberi TaxID=5762 RepID=D2UYP9_NAEGR|nr:uncharacterized protein NAEGRDRAFT_77820 [Naegleria gruberi]EFC50515.1 hypothetical protein NAEGRDRAFT_77820 [Naegleria gruberi]|eukprot:XP_002683259.1 hypothetical protein NAEGRDRAFT_77820 [Naegleria gruberi strain NEG-M]
MTIVFDLAYSNDNEVKLKRQKEMDDFKHNNKTLIAKNRALAENEYKQQILEKEKKEAVEEERKHKESQLKHLREVTVQEKQEEKNATTNFQVPLAMQMGLNQKRQPAPKMIAQTGVIYATLPPEEQRRYEAAAGYTPSFVMQRANQEAYTLVL